MKLAPAHEYSAEQEQARKKALRLEWLTFAYMATVIFLMYTVMGSSQAMKSAWIEDCLSLVPPIMFVISQHFNDRAPNAHFPYGLHRVASVGFLVSALALLFVGGYLVYDATSMLMKAEHPTIGMKTFFGHDLWLGWWMIPVLLWGTFPPIFLGRAKEKLAHQLFDKNLYTDAKMNKADWMTGAAAIPGVLGIAYGLWWADALAALLISVDILRDGFRQTRDAVACLMDRAPKELDGEDSDIPERIEDLLRGKDWVARAGVRVHEAGHLFFAEAFFESVGDKPVDPDTIREAVDEVLALDWRLQGFTLSRPQQGQVLDV